MPTSRNRERKYHSCFCSEHFGKSIGMGYMRPDLAAVGQKLKMLNAMCDAVVVEYSPYEPANAAIRVDG